MDVVTYLVTYLAGLYDALQEGGTQEVVDKTIAEVNNPTKTGLKAWLGEHAAQCATCGKPFDPQDPELLDEVLCPSCPAKTTTP